MSYKDYLKRSTIMILTLAILTVALVKFVDYRASIEYEIQEDEEQYEDTVIVDNTDEMYLLVKFINKLIHNEEYFKLKLIRCTQSSIIIYFTMEDTMYNKNNKRTVANKLDDIYRKVKHFTENNEFTADNLCVIIDNVKTDTTYAIIQDGIIDFYGRQ